MSKVDIYGNSLRVMSAPPSLIPPPCISSRVREPCLSAPVKRFGRSSRLSPIPLVSQTLLEQLRGMRLAHHRHLFPGLDSLGEDSGASHPLRDEGFCMVQLATASQF